MLIVSNDNFLSILPIYHGSKFQDLRYIFFTWRIGLAKVKVQLKGSSDGTSFKAVSK
jgi:hypothetical protein